MKHILSINDFSLEWIHRLFSRADDIEQKIQQGLISNVLNGAILVNLFFESSTRTRLSFHSAFARLGGKVITVSENTSFDKGESVEDAARVINYYADVIVIRHYDSSWIKRYALYSNIPVINAGNGADEHPTQALLDLYTIHKVLHTSNWLLCNKTIVFSGDLKYGRTVHSLLLALKKYSDIKIIAFAPEELQIPISLRSDVICTSSPEDLKHADIFYTTRLQKERSSDILDSQFFCINKKFVDNYLRHDIQIMHPLPRVYDLSIDLDDHPGFKVFEQVRYGIPIRMALFLELLSVKDISYQPCVWKNIHAND